MNVAGPSRPRPGRLGLLRESVESTYEEDLLRLLAELSVDEMDNMQTYFAQRASVDGPLSDHDVAMNDLLQQARALAAFNEDRSLAQLIAGEEDADFAAPPVWTPAAPAAPAAVAAVPPPQPTNQNRTANDNQTQTVRDGTTSTQTWGGWLSSVVGWAIFGSSETASTNAVPTTAPRNNRPTGHDCVICQDPIHGAEIRAPCGHYYDVGCVTDLFQSATRDETLYPPRCCRQNIPFAQVQVHLSRDLVTTFQQKQAEFSTLKRVYCSSPSCSRFLGPLAEGFFSTRVFTCPAPACGRRTCAQCRGSHNDWAHICRPDADATQVLELGRNSGWARCPGCSQMIELNIGCFHMTCRCRTEFCYLCRALWKTCHCPQWDERRLLAAAEERVDAQLRVERAPARRDVPVQPARPVPVPAPAPARRPEPLVYGGIPPLGPRQAQAAPAGVQFALPVRRPAAPVAPPAPARVPAVQVPALQPRPARGSTSLSPQAAQSGRVREAARQLDERLANTAGASTSTAPTRTARSPSASTSTSAAAARASASTSAFAAYTPRASTSGTASAYNSLLASSSTPTSTRASTSSSPRTSSSTSTSASYKRHTGCPEPSRDVNSLATRRQRMVHELMERLRVDHECNHGVWRYRHGGGICQTCGHHLPLYLFRCQGCELLACNRCRRNRL